MLKSSVGYKSELTSDNVNSSFRGVTPKGIYSGGSVVPGPGLSIRIEPFVAKSNDGFSVSNEEWTNLQLPNFTTEDITEWVLCLKAKARSLDTQLIEWQFLLRADYEVAPEPETLIVFSLLSFSKTNDVYPVFVGTSNINGNWADRVSLADPTRPYTGKASFTTNANVGTTIVHNLGTTDYHVFVQPIGGNVAPPVGEIFYEQDKNEFRVFSTGAPGTEFSWMLFLNRRSFPKENEILGIKSGRIILGGTAGIRINHSIADPADYFVAINIEPTQVPDTPGSAGHAWVEKGINHFILKNTGAAAVVNWAMIPTASEATLDQGTTTLSFRETITHPTTPVGTVDYFVAVTPISNVTGSEAITSVHRMAGQFELRRHVASELAGYVSVFANLPDASANPDKIYEVTTNTGTGDGTAGNEALGFYLSNGTVWSRFRYFADLPDATAHTGKVYYVPEDTGTGDGTAGNEALGLYTSNGTAWTTLASAVNVNYLLFRSPNQYVWLQNKLTMGTAGADIKHIVEDRYFPLVTYKSEPASYPSSYKIKANNKTVSVYESTTGASNSFDLLLLRSRE